MVSTDRTRSYTMRTAQVRAFCIWLSVALLVAANAGRSSATELPYSRTNPQLSLNDDDRDVDADEYLMPPASPREQEAFQALVEADWAAQERRWGRSPSATKAIRDALERASRLLEDLRRMPDAPDLAPETAALEHLRRGTSDLDAFDERARLALYRKVRSFTRELAFKNPLLGSRPIVFLKRRRFICQMLHEYLGYFYDYGDIAGGGVYTLQEPGRSLATRDLIAERLPRGNYTTLALAYDAGTIYFAFAERAAKKHDFYSSQRRCFQVFAMDADGANLRQLTDGPDDDFDPCPLPDGGIAFMSTRRGGFGRCHNPWEPLPAYTLHRMDASGGGVRTLSFHETNA